MDAVFLLAAICTVLSFVVALTGLIISEKRMYEKRKGRHTRK
jgi:hypothetical protein